MHYIKGENVKLSKKNKTQQKEADIKTNLQKKETYENAIKKSINLGVVAHIAMGIITAAYPSLFTGIKGVSFDCLDRLKIGSAIILFGLGGFTLSWLRSKRINWSEVIKYKKEKTDDIPNQSDEYNQYINTLSFTILSGIVQVVIACIIIVIFASVFMNLDPVESGFDYYNLMLATVFAIISTYITVVYKKEFFGANMPGFTIKPCKNPNDYENSALVQSQQTMGREPQE